MGQTLEGRGLAAKVSDVTPLVCRGSEEMVARFLRKVTSEVENA